MILWTRWHDTPWRYCRVPPEWFAEAEREAHRRREFQRTLGATPLFQTDPTLNELTGLLGEKAAASLFSTTIDTELRPGGDGGVDLRVGPLQIDVKTRRLARIPRPDDRLMVPDPQMRKLQDGLILLAMAWVQPLGWMFCLGWEGSTEFKNGALRWLDAPACPCHYLEYSTLRGLTELNDLITHLMVEAL